MEGLSRGGRGWAEAGRGSRDWLRSLSLPTANPQAGVQDTVTLSPRAPLPVALVAACSHLLYLSLNSGHGLSHSSRGSKSKMKAPVLLVSSEASPWPGALSHGCFCA